MALNQQERALVIVIVAGTLLFTGAALTMFGISYIEYTKNPYFEIPLDDAHPLSGKIYTTRQYSTLTVEADQNLSKITLTDNEDHRGGRFIIRDYLDLSGHSMAALRGDGYKHGMTTKGGDLYFTVPHFSTAAITPIYNGTYFRSRLAATQNDQSFAFYLDTTWTNTTLIFRGHNDTVSPQFTIGSTTYKYNAPLANGTYYNFTIPDAAISAGTVNHIRAKTASGGLDFALRGFHDQHNMTIDITRVPYGELDFIEYYNISFVKWEGANIINYNFPLGITRATHHSEILSILWGATNITHDSTLYEYNATAHRLNITLSTVTVGVTYAINATVLCDNNDPPVISSTPSWAAIARAVYAYQVRATDNDGDNITYALSTDATFLKIDNETGLIYGSPAKADQSKTYNVTVYANDSYGGSARQQYNLTVYGNPMMAIFDLIEGLCYGGVSLGGLAMLGTIGYYGYMMYSRRNQTENQRRQTQIAEQQMALLRAWAMEKYQRQKGGKKK